MLRDKMEQIAEFLPTVDQIEVLTREEPEAGRVHIVNCWYGNDKGAPKAVRPFLTADMTKWKDDALWIDEEFKVEWGFSTFTFDKLYDCGGVNRVVAFDDGTSQFVIKGALRVYPERVPGVPKFLAKRLRPKIEQWLIKMVTPNLAALPKAVQSFLDHSTGMAHIVDRTGR